MKYTKKTPSPAIQHATLLATIAFLIANNYSGEIAADLSTGAISFGDTTANIGDFVVIESGISVRTADEYAADTAPIEAIQHTDLDQTVAWLKENGYTGDVTDNVETGAIRFTPDGQGEVVVNLNDYLSKKEGVFVAEETTVFEGEYMLVPDTTAPGAEGEDTTTAPAAGSAQGGGAPADTNTPEPNS